MGFFHYVQIYLPILADLFEWKLYEEFLLVEYKSCIYFAVWSVNGKKETGKKEMERKKQFYSKQFYTLLREGIIL
jgi:hypothetical protein